VAENVTSDQCETRRLLCGEAMAAAMRRQETQFSGFLLRIEEKIDPLITESAKTGERCNANARWLGRAWVVVAGVIIALVGAGVVAVARSL